eukprot:TRINITY_DN43182_c0_g1_i1.p1 TRINITY_DN43182_c0_g1~~TRINITY_DN43182_c0_g1_i1.p1  ORF type:complete len:210 (+),score=31.86 TRINITY_DN43182_c0_g1_i1:64-693(+)
MRNSRNLPGADAARPPPGHRPVRHTDPASQRRSRSTTADDASVAARVGQLEEVLSAILAAVHTGEARLPGSLDARLRALAEAGGGDRTDPAMSSRRAAARRVAAIAARGAAPASSQPARRQPSRSPPRNSRTRPTSPPRADDSVLVPAAMCESLPGCVWRRVLDPRSGRHYYWNTTTQEVVWRPVGLWIGLDAPEEAARLAADAASADS